LTVEAHVEERIVVDDDGAFATEAVALADAPA